MTEETVAVEEGTPEETPELVSIEEATDEDLDSFLSEANRMPEPDEEPVETQPQKLEEQAPKKADEPAKPEVKPDAPVSAEEHRKVLERLKAKEQFIDRRGTEIGELRKQLREAKEKLSQLTTDDKWVEQPREAHRAQRDIDKVDDQLSALDQEEQELKREYVAQRIVAQHLTPEEYNVDAAAAMLAEDGVSEQFIQAFRANPHKTVYPETLVHIMKRAQLEQVLKKILPATKKLLEENQQLKQGRSAQATKTAQQIQRNLSQPAGINGSQATASASIEDAVSADISSMTDAELDSFLQTAKKRAR